MIIHDVFEKRQAVINYPIDELLQMLSEGRLVLRRQNKEQIRMIRNYIFDNILTEQIYLPPLVAYMEEGSLDDGRPDRFIIVDGTQRLRAFSDLEGYIGKAITGECADDQKKGFTLIYALEKLEIAVQIFEGMGEAEADQLFIDLNTKGKKVALSKRIAYDSRSSINQATNQVLQQHKGLKEAGVEEEKTAIVRPKNKNALSLSQLRRIIGYFMTGKTLSSSLSVEVESHLTDEQNIELMNAWFDELFKLHPARSIGDYDVSMLAGFPLLYAVAIYSVKGLQDLSFEEKKTGVIKRMRRLQSVNWSRDQSVWQEFNGRFKGRENYFYLSNDKRNIEALVAWLDREGGE